MKRKKKTQKMTAPQCVPYVPRGPCSSVDGQEEGGGKEANVEEDALPETSTPETASGTSPAAEEDAIFCQLCGGWLPHGPSLP